MAGNDHTPEIHEHADDWHHHSAAEGVPQHEHAAIVNTGSLMKWFVGIFVMLVIVIVALSMYFQRYKVEMRMKGIETIVSSTGANNRRAEAEKVLGLTPEGVEVKDTSYEYTVADKKAQTVHIPIAEAKKRTVAKYSKPAPAEPAQK